MDTDVGDRESLQVGPGAQVIVRDEVWLVRNVSRTADDGYKVMVVGVSDLVRDHEATFFTGVDRVDPVRPEETTLVADGSTRYRKTRLFLEAVVRKTPLPQSERGLATAGQFLLDEKVYQQRPAELALSGLRPRALVADVVGLGKTLEIGLILAELIRRGRGERILVVTPQQVLDQFQRELWTRFSIPLIRLDSVGIQRVRQRIPAGRNPFTHYKRAIISIDTLKNIGQYRHHLQNLQWDAVVIDESHNLIGGTSLRSQLASVLAPRTDAFLLASATPHNGDAKSFAELINLLDPTAIADTDNYSTGDISHLYLRRTKVSSEVRDQLRSEWVDRGPSVPVRCTATPAEERVFAELADVWLPRAASAPTGHDRLFPYTLLKSFLSSHRALSATIKTRLELATTPRPQEERAALTRLRELAEAAGGQGGEDPAKLTALLEQLKEIEVGPDSDVRVVVFSERVETLKWLQEVVSARLGFTGKAADGVELLYGGKSDDEQQKIIERFGLAESRVRILLTSDIASEGVNFHRACHHLIHYDLPWSLIRIEQRNGRIDRYGQHHSPQFRALILESRTDGAKDDTTVAEKLLRREAEAHAKLGTAEAVTGQYTAEREEKRLIQDLLAGKSVEEAVPEAPSEGDDLLADLLADVGAAPEHAAPRRARVPTLFDSTEQFFTQAIHEICPDPEKEYEFREEDGLIAFDPPKDLRQRLSVLPPSYLAERKVTQRLRLTFDRDLAQKQLEAVYRQKQPGTSQKKRDQTQWPDTSFLTDLHPVVEWLVDKVLIRLGRQYAPVITADVDAPVFLVQGVYSNALGSPTVLEWMAVSGLPGTPRVRSMFDVLQEAGVHPTMSNRGTRADLSPLQTLVPDAIEAARGHLDRARERWDAEVAEPLRAHEEQRLKEWEQASLFGETAPAPLRNQRRKRVETTLVQRRELVDSLATTGAPLLRLLAVLDTPAALETSE